MLNKHVLSQSFRRISWWYCGSQGFQKKKAKEGKTLDILPISNEHSGQSLAAHIAQT